MALLLQSGALMETLMWIIASTIAVSALSLVGIITIIIRERDMEKALIVLVSLSAGVLMGGAFLHLLPEALEKASPDSVFPYLLAGFVLFFIVEKVFHWRHCHKGGCEIHSFAYMNLLGDSLHNFIDGLIIAASFVADINLGIATTLAVALHELPQEIGDFGVLVYGKFSRRKALLMNFITAVTAVLGGVIGYFFSNYYEYSILMLLPVAGGGFIYIAASDLIPEIRKEPSLLRSMLNAAVFLVGIIIMHLLTILFH